MGGSRRQGRTGTGSGTVAAPDRSPFGREPAGHGVPSARDRLASTILPHRMACAKFPVGGGRRARPLHRPDRLFRTPETPPTAAERAHDGDRHGNRSDERPAGPLTSRRPDQPIMRTIGGKVSRSSLFRPRKSAGPRPHSGVAGSPVPRRRTFAPLRPRRGIARAPSPDVRSAPHASRDRPCPVAGRSLRPSMASAHSAPPALRPPGCAGRRGRLPGHGRPRDGSMGFTGIHRGSGKARRGVFRGQVSPRPSSPPGRPRRRW